MPSLAHTAYWVDCATRTENGAKRLASENTADAGIDALDVGESAAHGMIAKETWYYDPAKAPF